MSIRIEPIPPKCVGRNLHSYEIIDLEQWETISKRVRAARRQCQCCGRSFDMSELHAHEVWMFDEKRQVQILELIASVCTKCHSTIHFNFILSNQKFRDRDFIISEAHYLEVNNCEVERFEQDLNIALSRYRVLSQVPGEWAMDISYVIRAGFVSWEEINLENLEKIAPGSAVYLEPYRPKYKLRFNDIPVNCLLNWKASKYKRSIPKPCDICGTEVLEMYFFYDLRVRTNTNELYLLGTKELCPDCRKTIFYGSSKLFMKYRKTTRHYRKVNNCSLEECMEHARLAKQLRQSRENRLIIYFKRETRRMETKLFRERNEYLKRNRARFDGRRHQWYLSPIRNLDKFLDYL